MLDPLDEVRAELARGQERRAMRRLWALGEQAFFRKEESTLRAVIALAQEIRASREGHARRAAENLLGSYLVPEEQHDRSARYGSRAPLSPDVVAAPQAVQEQSTSPNVAGAPGAAEAPGWRMVEWLYRHGFGLVVAGLLVWWVVGILVGGKTSVPLNGADDPSWSPDGTKIVFKSDRPSGRPQLYVINADGSGLRRLTRGTAHDGDPAWSPDGKKIAFVESKVFAINSSEGQITRERVTDVYVMNADGSKRRQLTHNRISRGLVRKSLPAWSPDGRWIAYQGDWQGGLVSAIYLVSPRGGAPRRLTPISGMANSPAWSPDGSRIAFSFGYPFASAIWIMDANGRNWKRLTSPRRLNGRSGTLFDASPAWSPDGARIAFDRYNLTLNPNDEFGGIAVINVEGRRLRWLTQSGGGGRLAWSPDGRRIAFSRDGRIYVMNADGTNQRRLTK